MQLNIPTGLYLYLFFIKEVIMVNLFNPKKQYAGKFPCSLNSDFIQEYKGLSRREREIMWMQHRNLRKVFDEIERNELQDLPALRYEFKKRAIVTVMKDGHIGLREDHHYYSVPYKFIGCKVKIIYTLQKVNIYYKYECIASHIRNFRKYKYTTLTEHLASTHKFMSEWNPERFIKWARSIDKDIETLITYILDNRPHPEQAYKSCLGILNLEKKVGRKRLINACRRALEYGNYNYVTVKTILERKLDLEESEDGKQEEINLPEHKNIRGKEYYK